jgi:hypothetical protein
MDKDRPTLLEVVLKTIVTHVVTYTIMGLLASSILDYARFYAETGLSCMMRQFTDPMITAGPLFQPIRGILFGIVFWLLREPFFGRKRGWLVMWVTLVVLGILGTFGPTPGSLEGMFFTVFPLGVHLKGLPEVILQSLFMSLILFYWVNRPQDKWVNWVMGIAFVVLLSFPVVGLLFG